MHVSWSRTRFWNSLTKTDSGTFYFQRNEVKDVWAARMEARDTLSNCSSKSWNQDKIGLSSVSRTKSSNHSHGGRKASITFCVRKRTSSRRKLASRELPCFFPKFSHTLSVTRPKGFPEFLQRLTGPLAEGLPPHVHVLTTQPRPSFRRS